QADHNPRTGGFWASRTWLRHLQHCPTCLAEAETPVSGLAVPAVREGRLHQAEAERHRHGLDLRVDPELHEDALHVALDRERADPQTVRDLRRRLALGELLEHLELPWGQ